MFNWNRKRFKEIDAYGDSWAIAQGAIDGKPIFVRFRQGLKDAVGIPKYPFQIGIAVPLQHPTEQGLTTHAEGEQLQKIEDDLQTALCTSDSAVFALAITHNGMREFVFYANEWTPEVFEKKVKAINAVPHVLSS